MIEFLVRNLRWAAHPCAVTLESVMGYFGEIRSVRQTFDVLVGSIDQFALAILGGRQPEGGQRDPMARDGNRRAREQYAARQVVRRHDDATRWW